MNIITQEFLLKDIHPQSKELLDLNGLSDDAMFVRKGIVPYDLEFDEGERSVIAYITTAAVDRDNEIVDPNGAILKDYQSNPVVLFGHDHSGMPIGKCQWIKSDAKGLIAKTIYANTAQANELFEYRKAGFPMAQSIGFIPIQTERYEQGSAEANQGIRRKYTKWILLEYSDVPVPSNPEALQIAVSKGLLNMDKANDYTIVIDPELEPEPENTIKHELDPEPEPEDKVLASYGNGVTNLPPGSFLNGITNLPPDDSDDELEEKDLDDDAEYEIEFVPDEEFISAMNPEPEAKAGRVLSAKNATKISGAVSAMSSAINALNELLAATSDESSDEGKELIPDDIDIDGIEKEIVPAYEINIDEIEKEILTTDQIKAMIKEAVRQSINKARGIVE